MNRLKINILGISETRWPEDDDFWSDESRVINSSSANGQGEVAIILAHITSCTVDKIFSKQSRELVSSTMSTSYSLVVFRWYQRVKTVLSVIHRLLMPDSDVSLQGSQVQALYRQISVYVPPTMIWQLRRWTVSIVCRLKCLANWLTGTINKRWKQKAVDIEWKSNWHWWYTSQSSECTRAFRQARVIWHLFAY